MCPVVCSAVNLLTTQEDKLCDLGYLEFEVVTEHLILDVLMVGTEERKRGGGRKGRKEGREEEGGREGSLEKQTDIDFGGKDNGVTNLPEMGESKKGIKLLQTTIRMVLLLVPFEIILIKKNYMR